MRQHVCPVLRSRHQIGPHIVQDGLLAEIVADHVQHKGVDRLVVGDTTARGIDEGNVARPPGIDDAGHAEQRIGVETKRVEEIVIDAAIDHVDTLQPGGCLHVDHVVLDHQIAAFHQFDAHLLGQECMLEIGRIINTRRQDDDLGLVLAARRHVA